MKRRHSCAGNAVRDNVRDLRIGQSLHLWPVRDVGGTLGAPPVKAVASGTGRSEHLLALRRGEFCAVLHAILPWGLRPRHNAAGDPESHQRQLPSQNERCSHAVKTKPFIVKRSPHYFCFTAMTEISIRALLTNAAAWMVARAGLGSGMTPL